ncbi:MAG: helix-turn-helix domain-containing protein [Prevotella sp.]|nr:helix-turn-helix domain-containing protein [Prevotella sp.]
MTPHYLSILVKRDTGQPAKEWIEQALVSMLQADLKYSDKTIKALVTEYNFPSMSSFSRFFKRRTGMSPREFRQKG